MRAVPLLAITAVLLVVPGAAQAERVSCGQVITRDTRVSNDLWNCPGDGLVIGAHNITLNLAGHTIDGTHRGGVGAGVANGSIVGRTQGQDGVKIINGTVHDFGFGVAMRGVNGGVLSKLTLSSNGAGIEVDEGSTGVRLHDNLVSGNETGINVLGSDRNRVVDNVASGGNCVGIRVDGGTHNLVRGNETSRNACPGGIGIIVTETEANRIVSNIVSDNGNARVSVGINVIQGDDNLIARNVVTGNRTGIELFESSDRNEIASNATSSNTVDGISLIEGADNLVARNVASRNGDDGIDIDTAAGNTVARNRTNRNADLGIEATAGVIDGGGNSASGNGNPLQCVNVFCR